MTRVEQLALGCILPGFEGTVAPGWIRRRAAQGLGGVVLFARNVEADEQVAELSAALHAEHPELVVAIDEEGGDVTRLDARTGSRYPGNLALGAAGDPGLTAQVAASMGARLAGLGIGLNLAPVVDVNSNPQNPIIGVRSFGSDPRAVAEHAAAWIAGMQGAGVAACAKHFPGHGDTSVDSHVALPVAQEDPHLRALAPFEAAIDCGVAAIMSAHIVAAAIDELPATISHKVMTELLRGQLGFAGVGITDGLEMKGLRVGRSVGEAAVLALVAGCDALCVGGGLSDDSVVEEIVGAIAAAVDAGRLASERLAEAASRLSRLTRPIGATRHVPTSGEDAAQQAARRAIRADGPVRIGDHAAVIRFGSPSSIAAGDIPWGIAAALVARGVRVTEAETEIAGQAVVIAVRDLHRDPAHRARIDGLLERRPDAVVVEMGVPACRPPAAKAYIATHGSARVCADAAAELMHP